MTAVANSTTFQSSFELTGYITINPMQAPSTPQKFQSSFELTGYITQQPMIPMVNPIPVSKLFRAYRLYNNYDNLVNDMDAIGFKALSSLQVI